MLSPPVTLPPTNNPAGILVKLVAPINVRLNRGVLLALVPSFGNNSANEPETDAILSAVPRLPVVVNDIAADPVDV
jgi:hypothetical protein